MVYFTPLLQLWRFVYPEEQLEISQIYLKPWSNHDVYPRHVAKLDYLGIQFPYLQWNIAGMLFLLHTKRLNPNLCKKVQEQTQVLEFDYKLKLYYLQRHERNRLLPSWDSNWKELSVTYYTTLKTTTATKPHDICNSIWLVYYLSTTIFEFLSKFLFYFSFQ